MKKNSFDSQYPDYKIVPEKSARLTKLLSWIAAAVLVIALPYFVFRGMTQNQVPIANEAGFNKFSLSTLGNLAMSQSQQGLHAEAARNFQNYFQLGGQSTEAMMSYAATLQALGRNDLARDWSQKALEIDPDSKAGRFIKDSLGE